jgi:hypothetical protein
MLNVSPGCPDCRLAWWLVWGWVGGRGDEPGLVRDDGVWCVSGLFWVLPPPPRRLQGPGRVPPSGRLRCRAFPAAVGGVVCSRGCSRSAVDQLVVVYTGAIALLLTPPTPLVTTPRYSVCPPKPPPARRWRLTGRFARGSRRLTALAGRRSRVRGAPFGRASQSPLALGGLASLDLPLPVRVEALPASRFTFVHRSVQSRPPSGRPRRSRLATTRCAPRLWLRCLRRLPRRAVGPFGSPIPLLCRRRPSRLHGPGRRRLPFGRRRRPGYRLGALRPQSCLRPLVAVVVSSSMACWSGASRRPAPRAAAALRFARDRPFRACGRGPHRPRPVRALVSAPALHPFGSSGPRLRRPRRTWLRRGERGMRWPLAPGGSARGAGWVPLWRRSRSRPPGRARRRERERSCRWSVPVVEHPRWKRGWWRVSAFVVSGDTNVQ